MNLTLAQYISGVTSGTFSPNEVFAHYLHKAKEKDKHYHAFISFQDSEQDENMKKDTLLKGAPIGVKDLILTKGHVTTCASKMLEHYIPAYSATSYERLLTNGGRMIGKTNCDQFGM